MFLKDLLKVLDPFAELSITIDEPDCDDYYPCYEGDVAKLMIMWHDVSWDTYRRVISLKFDTTSDTYQVMLSGR